MIGKVIEDWKLCSRTKVDRDREDAREHLARSPEPFRTSDAFILAIPSGGVPVGLVVSSRLWLLFDLLIIRKVPIPGYTVVRLCSCQPGGRSGAKRAVS